MNIDDMQYLLAVAEHRNIGRAAEALGLTQPALTRALKRLEALAGQRLFTRHPKGVEPTDAGRTFLTHARRIRTEYGDALLELQRLKNGQLGLLRLGYSPSVGDDLVVAAARQLLAERPAATLKFGSRLATSLLDELVDGHIDLMVGPRPATLPPEVDALSLYTSHMYVIVDEDHPLLGRGPVGLAALAGEAWVMPEARATLRRDVEAAMAAAGLQLRVRVEQDLLAPAHFKLLRGTRLVGMCSDSWLRLVSSLGLQPLEVPALTVERDICVLHRRGQALSPLAQRLVQLLQEQVAAGLPVA